MARMIKFSTGIVGEIKHNLREFKDGICPTNIEVDPARKGDNYSLLRRGKTALEIEGYRKKIEAECFHYNRKNLVHVNEIICTLPNDCPSTQEHAFFQESLNYIASTLPMGERCIILAEVHADEGHISKDGKTIVNGAKHLHVMYVPAVQDAKHEGFDYKLCSDALTRRNMLQQWHPSYQAWIDKAEITATVASGVTSGKGVSVKAMKEISKVTGLSLEEIQSLKIENERLQDKLREKEQELLIANQKLHEITTSQQFMKPAWGEHTWENEIEKDRLY